MDLGWCSDDLAAVVLRIDRVIPFEMLKWMTGLGAVLSILSAGAKGRNEELFEQLCAREGWRDGQGKVGDYTVRARGESSHIIFAIPKKRWRGRFVFDKRRDSDALEPPMTQIRTGRPPCDAYFGKRFVDPQIAEAIARDPSLLDGLVGFVKKWGLRMTNFRVSDQEIELTLYEGSGPSRHSYLPMPAFQQLCSDLPELAESMELVMATASSEAPSAAATPGALPAAPTDAEVSPLVASASSWVRITQYSLPLTAVLAILAAFLPVAEARTAAVVVLAALTLALLVHANLKTTRPIVARLGGSRPLGEAVWGQFAMALVPFMGIILALEEAKRASGGVFQIGEHDHKPESFEAEIVPRARFYYTLVFVWPAVILAAVGHTLLLSR